MTLTNRTIRRRQSVVPEAITIIRCGRPYEHGGALIREERSFSWRGAGHARFRRQATLPKVLVSMSGLFDGPAIVLFDGLPATGSRVL
jgi:hypothetical protein